MGVQSIEIKGSISPVLMQHLPTRGFPRAIRNARSLFVLRNAVTRKATRASCSRQAWKKAVAGLFVVFV